ncbi:hypothetical protein PMAYCL1PPCAC_30504 [Pristionchus mayeri]|uniref:Uncharacterized protein n=1 Tax=Pristionchus mayeri TaxID=1317129 RepID=A0AAN5DEB4_9BILA|nr:hypothetical protein PMAYCL1PPCAC_30504 [Pristionchus mayeri]
MSRESLEASVDVGEDIREISHIQPSTTVLKLPVGVGVSLALSDFSSEVSSMSGDSGEESAATMEETQPEAPRLIRQDKGHSTVTCMRQEAEGSGEQEETPTSSTNQVGKENTTCTIAFDMHKIRRFPPSEATLEEQVDRLREYNYELQMELRRLLGGDSDRTRLVSENLEYKMKLEEMNEYIDRIDIEAEQEFDVITRELELHQRMASEERASAIALERHLNEKEEENRKLRMSNDALQMAHMKQKEIIENMSQQLDSQSELNEQIDQLKRQLKEERENFKRKELIFSCDLDEVQRELNTQKEVLHAGGVGEIIRVWNGKIEHLENELRERDSIIFTQQHLINEMRRQASGSSINTTNSSLGNKSLEPGEKAGPSSSSHY